MVCRPRKSLYSLKQAPRAWFEKFQSTVCSAGFQQSLNDHSLFIRQSDTGIIVLVLYVDDMVITDSDEQGIIKFKKFLNDTFHMKDLGTFNLFYWVRSFTFLQWYTSYPAQLH